jgi:hypothetical protein
MRQFMASVVSGALLLSAAQYCPAADDPKPASDKPPAAKPTPGPAATPGQGGGGGGRGFGGGFGGPGGAGGFGGGARAFAGQRDPLDELLALLGDLNLAPDFTLAADQKSKIQVIRDGFKKTQDEWRSAHADELKKMQEDMAQLRGGGQGAGGGQAQPPDREKMQELFQARQELMQSAPKSDEAAVEIKGLLTTEQLKKLEVRQTERQAEMERMRNEMPRRFGPGGGAGGNGPGAGGGRGRRGGGGGGADGGGAEGGGGGGAGSRRGI